MTFYRPLTFPVNAGGAGRHAPCLRKIRMIPANGGID
jgi:hypothetical protein